MVFHHSAVREKWLASDSETSPSLAEVYHRLKKKKSKVTKEILKSCLWLAC